MAQRRMLSKRISQSKKVNNLRLKAQIVWTWTIPYLDDYGCYTGDPEDIKTEVFPKNKRISAKDIENALKEESKLGLIVWYVVGEDKLIQHYQNFETFQTFKTDRARVSEYPQYQPENEDIIPIGNQEIPKVSLKLSKDKLNKDKYMDSVFLTKEEYQKLVTRFGEQQTKDLIAELAEGIGSKGYKYKSHYYTILRWYRKNHPPPPPKPTTEEAAAAEERKTELKRNKLRAESGKFLREKSIEQLKRLRESYTWQNKKWLIDEVLKEKKE